MKSITIFQNCQQSTTFSNATFSEKCWKLLQLHVTENGKRYLIYYITTYLLIFYVIFLKDCNYYQN